MQIPKPKPSQKLHIASALYATAKKVKSSALRQRHADWSEHQIIKETNRCFLLFRD